MIGAAVRASMAARYLDHQRLDARTVICMADHDGPIGIGHGRRSVGGAVGDVIGNRVAIARRKPVEQVGSMLRIELPAKPHLLRHGDPVAGNEDLPVSLDIAMSPLGEPNGSDRRGFPDICSRKRTLPSQGNVAPTIWLASSLASIALGRRVPRVLLFLLRTKLHDAGAAPPD